MKIALLGAESTGKTQLAHELATHLQSQGQTATAVDEYLREWCEHHVRTPRPDEQQHIAQIQQSRIEEAAKNSAWVFADTTPLMTAIYSEFIFQDASLTPAALAYQKTFNLTLITGLDMPWQADGIQRDGAHVRAPIDALLRQRLQTAGVAYEVIYGTGQQRTAHALQAIARQTQLLDTTNSIAPRADSTPAVESSDLKKWQSRCEKCSDPDCEHQLFRKLIGNAANA
jgi:nicotinamide riboside kinase